MPELDIEAIRPSLRRWWEAACQDKPTRPSCRLEDGYFVLTISNRDNWDVLLKANGVPDYALREEEGDTLTCTWESWGDYIFGDGGMMQRRSDKYEMRSAQLHMARTIQRAIEMGETAVIEAGTGTGKSFAYAAVCMAMGLRLVISTSNKALQAQLYYKDLPFLAELFPGRTYALALGKSNYACRLKAEDEGDLFNEHEAITNPELRDWYLNTTQTGSVEEIRFPTTREELAAITADDDCTGRHCPLYGACFYYKAHAQRMAASVVVCNHALLVQNHMTGGSLLPDWDVLVVDEAHNVVGDMRSAVGAELTVNAMHQAIKLTAPYVASETVQFADALVGRFASEAFDGHESESNLQVPVRDDAQYPAGEKLRNELYNLADLVWDEYDTPVGKEEAKQQKRAERVRSVAGRMHAFLAGEQVVRWLEVGRDNKQTVMAMPHYVGDWMQAMIAGRPAVFCSATLATPTLRPFMDSIGSEDAFQMVAPSPFDYERNALIYVPRSSDPKPADDGYKRWLAEQLTSLVAASKGGALLLFTSYKQMNDMYTALAYSLRNGAKLTVLKQGDGIGRQELIRQFKQDGNAVLFATRSFFEGVDIGGHALRLVVLDKLPFEAPSPMGEALERAAGARSFDNVRMPTMLVTLKQAVGRLIRTQTDRGVIAVLDSRIRGQWPTRIFESLPDAPNTASIGDVVQFFAPPPKDPVHEQVSLFEEA